MYCKHLLIFQRTNLIITKNVGRNLSFSRTVVQSLQVPQSRRRWRNRFCSISPNSLLLDDTAFLSNHIYKQLLTLHQTTAYKLRAHSMPTATDTQHIYMFSPVTLSFAQMGPNHVLHKIRKSVPIHSHTPALKNDQDIDKVNGTENMSRNMREKI